MSTSLLKESVSTELLDFTHTSSPAPDNLPCNKHGVDGRNVPAAMVSLPVENNKQFIDLCYYRTTGYLAIHPTLNWGILEVVVPDARNKGTISLILCKVCSLNMA